MKCSFVVVALAGGSIVLWTRQTSEALLHVHSYPAAIGEVALFALPTLALFMVIARGPMVVVVEGLAIVVLLTAGWWSFATDRHSTASLGPGLYGWFGGPTVIVGVWAFQRGLGGLREPRDISRRGRP